MSIDPSTAAARVTAGVDWAKDDHAVCVAGAQGEALERFAVRHDAAGLREMAARLLRAGVSQADSRHASPWAASLYDKAVARGCDRPHAVRILARAWAHVIWRCWQDHAPYNPAAHNSLQKILRQHRPIAA